MTGLLGLINIPLMVVGTLILNRKNVSNLNDKE
jgi:hypothetical protein